MIAKYYVQCYHCGWFGKPQLPENLDGFVRCPKCLSARNSHYDKELVGTVKIIPVYKAESEHEPEPYVKTELERMFEWKKRCKVEFCIKCECQRTFTDNICDHCGGIQ